MSISGSLFPLSLLPLRWVERSAKPTGFRSGNYFLNEIPGSGPDIVKNTTYIFTEQAKADEQGTNEDKKNGKQGEHALGRPLLTQNKPHDQQQNTKGHAAESDGSAEKRKQP